MFSEDLYVLIPSVGRYERVRNFREVHIVLR